ncbi:unnamed protein product [Sphagnum jensenii]
MKLPGVLEMKNKSMFLAMRDIFYGGEFASWLKEKEMPLAAMKEYEEAMKFFEQETGFDCETGTLTKK